MMPTMTSRGIKKSPVRRHRSISPEGRRSRSPIHSHSPPRSRRISGDGEYLRSRERRSSIHAGERIGTSPRRRNEVAHSERHDPGPTSPLPSVSQLQIVRITVNNDSADPKAPESRVQIDDVFIPRRSGEGSRPMFQFLATPPATIRHVELVKQPFSEVKQEPSSRERRDSGSTETRDHHPSTITQRDQSSSYRSQHSRSEGPGPSYSAREKDDRDYRRGDYHDRKRRDDRLFVQSRSRERDRERERSRDSRETERERNRDRDKVQCRDNVKQDTDVKSETRCSSNAEANGVTNNVRPPILNMNQRMPRPMFPMYMGRPPFHRGPPPPPYMQMPLYGPPFRPVPPRVMGPPRPRF